MTSNHPELEDLLLWQSGELSPEKAEAIASHLAACRECQAEMEGLESLREKVVRVNTLAAKRSFHAVLEDRSTPHWCRISALLLTPRAGMAAVASVLIVALVLFSMTEFTPEARADTLLRQAVAQQAGEPQTPHLLRVESGSLQCRFAIQLQDADARSVALRNGKECQTITDDFRAAGWTKDDLLSAQAFQRWRKALPQKKDSIRKMTGAVEVTTRAEAGPIRQATLRLRSSDHHPVYEKVEFATNVSRSSIEITEAALNLPENADTKPPVEKLTFHPSAIQPHVVDPLDIAEAQARLALHHAGEDRNVLIAVVREPAAVKVWGVVPSSAIRQQLAEAMRGLPDVKAAIHMEGEQQSEKSAVPWQAYRGDAPPLGFDEIQSLYSSDIEGRQKLLNSLDEQTRELVAEARSRDALLRLASRIEPVDPRQAEQLRQAASELEIEMLTDLSSLRDSLHPLAGAMAGRLRPLNANQALHVYRLVHEVFFQAKASDPMDLGTALGQIRSLIGG